MLHDTLARHTPAGAMGASTTCFLAGIPGAWYSQLMSQLFSPHIEQLIQHALATGLFTSREAVIEAGVSRLLEDAPQSIPPEHVSAVLAGLDEDDAGQVAEMTEHEWDKLRQLARDTASRNSWSAVA